MMEDRFDIGRLEGPEEEYVFNAGPAEAGARLDAALAQRYRWLSRSEAKRLIRGGKVFVHRGGGAAGGDSAAGEREHRFGAGKDKAGGRSSGLRAGKDTAGGRTGRGEAAEGLRRPGAPVVRPSFRLAPGDRVTLHWPRNPQDRAAAEAAPPGEGLAVLYEDECLIVVDKPAGVAVHPAGGNLFRTVLFALHRRCREAGIPPERMPILAHRLDVETSGVLLAVKGKEEAAAVAGQFRSRRVRKEYSALVYGAPAPPEGVVDLPLGPAAGSRVPYKQGVLQGGAPARTRYRVERTAGRISLVRLLPGTGRKHQLRVHMAAIGHPVVGDKIYGPDEAHYFKAREGPPSARDLEELLLARHALHSSLLALRHPRTGDEMVFEAPLPADFLSLLEGEGDEPKKRREKLDRKG